MSADKNGRSTSKIAAVAGVALVGAMAYGTIAGSYQGGNGIDTFHQGGSSQVQPIPQVEGGPGIHSAENAVNWSQVAKSVTPSVVSVRVTGDLQQSLGSGVVLTKEGRIVTNAHVVESAKDATGKIGIILADNTFHAAKLVKADASADLAVLQLESPPKDLQPIAVGKSSEVAVGDPVLAIGNPLGLSGTVTSGIISSVDRPMQANRSESEGSDGQAQSSAIYSALQTNAAINQGNSGGALVNAEGQLIGINSSIATTGNSQGSIGIGFAIPSDAMARVTAYLMEGKDFPYGKVGIQVSQGVANLQGQRVLGAQVRGASEGGDPPAGLRENDVIVEAQGRPTPSDASLVAEVRSYPKGETLSLKVVRGGRLLNIAVTLS